MNTLNKKFLFLMLFLTFTLLNLSGCSTPKSIKKAMEHSSYDRQQQAAQQADRQLDRETAKLK